MTAARVAQASEVDHDEHAYWALVWETAQEESGKTALRCGLGLLRSADVLERKVGCDVVGNVADAHESLRSEAATALMALAEVETAARVLSSLVCGLGRAQDPRAVPVLVRLSGHEDADLRRQVASEITFVNSGLPDGPDVQALIRLTQDQDPEVRNWAAFTLGFQLEQDTTAIRDALWKCTTDECGEVRAEGARGLARRHDPRAVPLIARLLDSDDGSQVFTLDAAAILGVPELLPALAAHEPDPPETDRAIAACDPVRRARLEDDAWTVVVELDRLRSDIGAALSSPRYESVHSMKLTHRETADAGYDAASLLSRAVGDPVRAAELVVADLTGSAGSGPRTDRPSQSAG
ncbi:HEAT repeat domain-containing protein [Streptomyces sp. NPDC086993]|uniref:HEAT repeat domain-containing protein n=1 Tax=unclassified Streptomyces TaxID=2593676 RepID=UPI002E76E6E5|nr:HEAT repeat domain-containing protein [Streptomyces sp. JV190]MEE1839926.1 HEAT repeat domain-containing protein [Streptomyces sp. JV190]